MSLSSAIVSIIIIALGRRTVSGKQEEGACACHTYHSCNRGRFACRFRAVPASPVSLSLSFLSYISNSRLSRRIPTSARSYLCTFVQGLLHICITSFPLFFRIMSIRILSAASVVFFILFIHTILPFPFNLSPCQHIFLRASLRRITISIDPPYHPTFTFVV